MCIPMKEEVSSRKCPCLSNGWQTRRLGGKGAVRFIPLNHNYTAHMKDYLIGLQELGAFGPGAEFRCGVEKKLTGSVGILDLSRLIEMVRSRCRSDRAERF